MPDDRVIIQLPSTIIRLNGAIRNTLSTIQCATSNLTYRDYISIDSTFLLVSQFVFGHALKSISLDSQLCFESTLASAYVKKNTEAVTDEMIITALFISSLEKTMELHSDATFVDEVELSSIKSVGDIFKSMLFSVDGALFSAKEISIKEAFGFDCEIGKVALQKYIGWPISKIALDAAFGFVSQKHANNLNPEFMLSMSTRFSIGRFRKLLDIDDLRLGDIYQWDMETFDIIAL